MAYPGGGGDAPAPTHTEAPAPTQTHTETSALLHSHDTATSSYTHDNHNHNHNHDHHHHNHHHHHHDQYDDDTTQPPTGAPANSVFRRQGDSQGGHESNSSRSSGAGVFARAASAVLLVGLMIYFLYIWNQAGNAIPGSPPSPFMSTGNSKVSQISSDGKGNVEDRVNAILSSTPLIDGHNDLAIYIRFMYKNNITSPKFRSGFEHDGLPENVDLPRLRSGQSGGAFWSAFVGCPINASLDTSNANYASSVSATLEQIDLLTRLQAQYSRDFTPAISMVNDPSGRENMILRWHAMKSLFGPLSIEGLHQIPPTSPFSTLRLYYSLGVRMATLTWNCHNPFADASLVMNTWTSPPEVVNGIFRPNQGAVTTRGKQVLREMNRLGMIIDISHTSYWTQKAVLTNATDKSGRGITRAPVVFSHSSAYTLCPHPRNVRDDILDLVPASNSLVMVNFSPGFISCTPSNETDTTPPDTTANTNTDTNVNTKHPHFSLPTFYAPNNTLHQVARHILHIGNRIGFGHVGIGSDYDGMGETPPTGLEGVDKYPDLVAELLRLGLSDDDARKVVGGNLLRVWKDVDRVAEEMRREGVPMGVDEVYFDGLE